MKHLLEVCCADAASVEAAMHGGADRIELCSSLQTGGLTPSRALIDYAVRLMKGHVNVLIRPRDGDFLYTPGELNVIENDIRHAVAAGASGIVFGALTAEGLLDIPVMKRMIKAADGASFTLHRAFDVSAEPEKILEEAVALGIDRILTSGLAPDVEAGVETLRRLNTLADGRIVILAGGGVHAGNAPRIIRHTGVHELHASCKATVPSRMKFHREGVSMAAPGNDEYSRTFTSCDKVSLLAQTIHSLNTPSTP